MIKKTLLSILLSFPLFLFAADLVVNTTGDSPDANPGDGVCADASGNCSLRAAIEEANALAGPDVIHVFDALQPVGELRTIALSSMLPPLISDITILGPENNSLIISGNNSTRIFYAKSGTILLKSLKLANGLAMGGSGSAGGGGGMGAGGALLMHEGMTGTLNLVLEDVILTDNRAQGGNGSKLIARSAGGGGGMGGNGGINAGGGGGFLGNGGNGVEGEVDDSGDFDDDSRGGGGGGFFGNGTNAVNRFSPGNGGLGNGGQGSGDTDDGNSGMPGAQVFLGEEDAEEHDDISDDEGGFGGFGGGGGGANKGDDDSEGGDGGFGGGGGGANEGDDDSEGGDGGFGGGGGASTAADDSDGGDGGFGASGGAAEGNQGVSDFGAGAVDDVGNSGGGLGAGGAVFVVSGQLTLNNVSFNNNTTLGGTGADTDNDGQGLAGAVFIYDAATHGAVDGKSNAAVTVTNGSGICFTNNSGANAAIGTPVGDGATANNTPDIYGLITGAIPGLSATCPICFEPIAIDPIPSLSTWGLVIFAFLLLSLSMVFLLNYSNQVSLANRGGYKISEQLTFPFDKNGALKALEKSVVVVTLIAALVFFVWGEFIVDDIIGLSMLAPVLAYFIYLISLFKKENA